MSKTKTPFLSLGAHGSLANTLTSQKRGAGTLLRRKPTPAYRYSLPQAYHRWLYQDYVAYWHIQTAVVKQLWETNARPYHMTGFAYWMKYHLTNLPDIASMWHLDNITNSLTPDSSKNANPLTVYGASLTPGVIDQCLSFDGLDDRLSHPTFWDVIPSEFTIMTHIYLSPDADTSRIIGKTPLANNEFQLRVRYPNQPVDFNTLIDGVWIYLLSTDNVSPSTWYLVTAIYKAGEKSKLYLNTTEYIAATAAGTLPSGTLKDFTIGARYDGYQPFKGLIDEVRIYNRALDITEIKLHSERGYPV